MNKITVLLLASTLFLHFAFAGEPDVKSPLCISGRYPHLAMFNHNGECGTGALAVWADRLWVITYGPHMEHGSDDKLYEIDEQLNRVTRPESVGGTPADRMIHRESNQLIIGPYFIDEKRNVRAISPKAMPGRITAAFRSLTDPANKIDFYMMEGSLWEADVKSLDAKQLFEKPIPGWHGKGAYSGQGRLVLANNGETPVGNKKFTPLTGPDSKDAESAGALAEFDGKGWRLIERRQFTDVTGPGGINGAPAENGPLWAIGWDKRSLILTLLDGGVWHTFRLPKADHSYDGKHGWHTEWPRIREVLNGKLLLNMHGGWFEFPKTMSASNYGGLKPLGSYLKITGDFCAWKDRIVFGCDDLAKSDFRNTKDNPLAPQSQSNLWFTTWDGLTQCGCPAGWGGPWQGDAIKAGVPSVPYLFGGYAQRVLHLTHENDQPVRFAIEIDAEGTGKWSTYQKVTVPAHGYAFHVFPENTLGQWVRVTADADCAKATAYFHYGPGGGAVTDRAMFAAIPELDVRTRSFNCGFIRPLGADKGNLLFNLRSAKEHAIEDVGEFEIVSNLDFKMIGEIARDKEPAPPPAQVHLEYDDASVIVIEDPKDGGKRFRLPKTLELYERLGAANAREVREIVTERSILNAHGSMYMLPRPISGGIEHIKPICTHRKYISDFGSWRGLLCIGGTLKNCKPDGHYFASADGKAGLWFGDIDDLWKMGKPVGVGGPWKNTAVKDGAPSDPYLMTGYDKKTIALSHDAQNEVTFTIEVNFDFAGWHTYQKIKVPAGKTIEHEFPTGYSAHWLRVLVDTDCSATAQCKYE